MLIALFLHIALTVHRTPAVSSGLIDAAVAEAAGIWAPYGVAIDAAPDGCEGCGACGATDDSYRALTIVAIERRRSTVAPGWHGALGAITFGPDGAPAPVITVFLTDIERFIALGQLAGLSAVALAGDDAPGDRRPGVGARDRPRNRPLRAAFSAARRERADAAAAVRQRSGGTVTPAFHADGGRRRAAGDRR